MTQPSHNKIKFVYQFWMQICLTKFYLIHNHSWFVRWNTGMTDAFCVTCSKV